MPNDDQQLAQEPDLTAAEPMEEAPEPAAPDEPTATGGEYVGTGSLTVMGETGPETMLPTGVNVVSNEELQAALASPPPVDVAPVEEVAEPDEEEKAPEPEPLYPDGTVLFYRGPSDMLNLSGKQINKGNPFFYDRSMDEVLASLAEHGHQFSLMSPEQRENTPDHLIG